ncbi:PREDICTED: carboxypeptidase O [Gavialis gangeticus]|uniref:carboxypeptidase O n=1 Tax=Gavialis gangeticus TaxID=94835 RepID=UPI00092E268A|nr:PREDICTED: carboxypeptidase O [Gavialis gangeticus]
MYQIKESNRELVTQHYLGTTYEKRPMYYLKISQPTNKAKKIIWMDCGIHAIEWISPAFCQWFVKEARLWRKSRSSYMNGTCFGTDLNRNFNSSWGGGGTSHNCSSSTFCGPEAESEPKTKAVARLIESRKSDILCFLTIHSFGQLILSPYGYTKEHASNHQELVDVAQKAATVLKGKHGTNFTVGPASSVLYQNSGSSRDWAHMIGIPFSYTLELRDRGAHAFFLPVDQIQPTCEETTVAVMTIIEYVNQKYFPNGAKLTSGNLCLNLLLSVLFMGALS